MTEWGVVTVIIALVGFVAAVSKPLISLTRAITELTSVVKNLQEEQARLHEEYRQLDEKTTEGRHRIWAAIDELKRNITEIRVDVGRLKSQNDNRGGIA